jgi:hypothetical protein
MFDVRAQDNRMTLAWVVLPSSPLSQTICLFGRWSVVALFARDVSLVDFIASNTTTFLHHLHHRPHGTLAKRGGCDGNQAEALRV